MQTKKILIVDDDAQIRSVLTTALRARNYEVIEASNGQEALDLFNKDGIAAVILDMKMPVMDGLQFLKAIKDSDGHSVPIIVTSTASYTKQAVLEAGATLFLDKVENTPTEIIETLESLLKRE